MQNETREIKFRAWSGTKEQSRYSYGMHSWEEIIESIDDERGWWKSIFSIGTDPESEMILMQYTGLKDKNGKEIYEGDILQLWEYDRKAYKVEIKWNEHYLAWGPWCTYVEGSDSPYDWEYDIEVIGNIYENPELIGGE